MNILILTNLYPAPDLEKENTPVVHYFAQEWVKIGCNVRVIHYPANFPRLIMWGASLFKSSLSNKVGSTIRTTMAVDKEYELDGVKVKRIPLLKYKLHGAFSENRIYRAYEKTVEWLDSEGFTPDVITSHWVNPQLEIMAHLRSRYHVGTCYVAHTPTKEFTSIYHCEKINQIISAIDRIGFRSIYIRDTFVDAFGYNGPSFQCYSGIPEQYIPEKPIERDFHKINRFVFVGTLIKRKYPAEIVPSVVKAMDGMSFEIKYIGKGSEEKNVQRNAHQFGVKGNVHLMGRMPRDEVVKQLQQSDVFVMNSRSEAFGLVYLEAMAQGCITIASLKEGFDGIIRDGENGFLCRAGDIDSLASTIRRIREMSPTELKRISDNAVTTARGLTNVKAAAAYLEQLKQLTSNVE